MVKELQDPPYRSNGVEEKGAVSESCEPVIDKMEVAERQD